MKIPLPETKVMTLGEAVKFRNALKEKNLKVAVTNGCFDIMHLGHAEYLTAARNTADALIALINSDESVRRLKGPSRPVCSEHNRAVMLAALSAVDAVVVFNSQRCNAELAALAPDVYVKGGDYTVETLDPAERAALLECNAEFRFIPFVPGCSTSLIISKILEGK